ncbi:hypothetical protein PTKIN_Ptkin12aG0178400 [Pterospermum kingtungense]
MRIRKNAKLSSVIYPQGSRPETVHVCELNQSPWDAIPFSQEPDPSFLYNQFQAQDSFNGNGSLGDSIGAVESVTSILESEEKAIMNVEGMVIHDNNDDNDDGTKMAKQIGFKSQCEEYEEEKQSGLLKSCNSNNDSGNPSSLTAKKAADKNNQLSVNRRGRARTAKKGSKSASNPYEFYYYSGFGPLWGKRRGGGSGGEISRNNIIEEAKEGENCSAITTQNNTTPSSSSRINDNEGFDYVDDDDDEEEEEDDENGDSGKKRMRKPIKARSLKSLM